MGKLEEKGWGLKTEPETFQARKCILQAYMIRLGLFKVVV